MVVKAQLAPLDAPHARGRESKGINAASRDLGIDRTEAQRSVKVASLTPEAKQAAIDAGEARPTARGRAPLARASVPTGAYGLRNAPGGVFGVGMRTPEFPYRTFYIGFFGSHRGDGLGGAPIRRTPQPP